MNAVSEVVPSDKTAHKPVSRWRQVVVITLAAVALYVVIRRLPTGTNLSHMDFRAGAGSIEFCDPANPQFMPVVSVRSPVAMTLATATPAKALEATSLVLTLKTSTGKPVAAEDLLVVHTQKLHLLVADPTLTDYQHIHPRPGERAGEWVFSFTPKRAGLYRLFADFTPAATGLGLYASTDLDVAGPAPDAGKQATLPPRPNGTYLEGEYQYTLQPAAEPIHAGKSADLVFSVSRIDGGELTLQPVMGAYSHLVAFDAARTGFAHLHPNQAELSQPLEPRQARLTFKLTIPTPGRYVVWSQVNLGGRERFAPFWFEVLP